MQRNYYKWAGVMVLAGVIGFSSFLFANNVTVTTYYPAPFGAYDRVKLVPRDSLPRKEYCDGPDDVGVMYYDNGQKEMVEGIYVCQQLRPDDSDWVLISRPVMPDIETAANHKVVCIKPNGHFGVCMNNPSMDGTCGCM